MRGKNGVSHVQAAVENVLYARQVAVLDAGSQLFGQRLGRPLSVVGALARPQSLFVLCLALLQLRFLILRLRASRGTSEPAFRAASPSPV